MLNLEGLWTRYEDPELAARRDRRRCRRDKATARMQEIYSEPIKPELITERIREIRAAGVVSCASVTPQRTEAYAKAILDAELDLLVIQGTVVSAEHVSKTVEPLNLKRFVRELDIPVIVGGCAQLPGRAAPHAHRRRRHPRRRRPRRTPARPAACSASACRRPPPSPTPAPPACATSTRPACTSTSSPTAAWAPAATSPRRSCAAPTR